jgi:uncharacterized protein (DUF433 family)
VQLEGYFDFLTPNDIRIKGSRIGIESVLYEYIHNARTAEEIKQRFNTLTLEQVYATILYYLHDQEMVGAYLANHLEYCRKARAEYDRNPPSGALRLRKISERLEEYPPEERAAALRQILAAEEAAEPEPARAP